MKYRQINVTAQGGPENMQIVERDLRSPAAGDARVKILAVPVVQDDVSARRGRRPWLPEFPFTPGYAFLGTVDRLDPRMSADTGPDQVKVGDRVIGLSNFGGYAEYIYWPADELVRVPENLNPLKTAVLILNYLVAYQILHRVAKVKAGEKALIVGASGGCGTAFLQLGRVAGLQMYGLASAAKHDVLRVHGAAPIDYKTDDFVQVIRAAEPGGIDYVFNGMFTDYVARGLRVLKRPGLLVQYGAPETKKQFFKFLWHFVLTNLLPNGKKIDGYGTHRLGVDLFQPDWQALFELLETGQIDPVIAARFPILEAAEANALLESGQVSGNIVLGAPEILELLSKPDTKH